MAEPAMVLVTRALDFAARAHVGQHRKGLAQEPYVNHLIEVVRLIAEATGGDDPVLLAAAALHDTLEDTATVYEDLSSAFGEEVAKLVAEVTDDKSLAKEVRKRLQIETVAKKSLRARLIKIADKTSNVRALLSTPPAGWTRERMLDYVAWAEAVVSQCRGLNVTLDAGFITARDEARREIESKVT